MATTTPDSITIGLAGSSSKRMILLASIGGGLEYYDFIVYALFARSIGNSFFSSSDPALSLVGTYLLFAASYGVRPVAGIIIANFVDRFGRKPVFIWSLLIMSLSTIAMSLLPSFASLGAGTTVCFVVLRLVQSACFGGEIGVATTYVTEMSPRRAGTACGILFGLLGVGVVLAGGVNAAIHAVFPPGFADIDGWRVAFFFGGVLGVVGYFVRGALEETPVFATMKESTQRAPLAQLLRDHRPALCVGIGLSAATGVVNGILFAYLPAFLPSFGKISSSSSALILFTATVFNALGVILIGYLSDKTSWIKLHRLGCFGTLIAVVPVLGGLASGVGNPLVWVILFATGAAIINGCIGQLLADIFPASARASGITASYNLSAAIFQGLTPLAATVAIRATGSALSPAILVAIGLLLALVSGFWCKRIGGHLSVWCSGIR